MKQILLDAKERFGRKKKSAADITPAPSAEGDGTEKNSTASSAETEVNVNHANESRGVDKSELIEGGKPRRAAAGRKFFQYDTFMTPSSEKFSTVNLVLDKSVA